MPDWLKVFSYTSKNRDTRKRSMVKSIVWRAIGILMLGGIAWLITDNWEDTTIIVVIFHSIRFVMYFFHERIWDNIEWGRRR